MTDEHKAAAAAKRQQTIEQKRQRALEAKLEHERTISVLREIRDNPDATPSDRLQAIAILSRLQPRY